MRVSSLLLSCLLLVDPAMAQIDGPGGRHAPGWLQNGGINVPLGSATSLASLERAALMGDRRAVALLALMLQDSPQVENSLVKSAIHFQVAIVAGCSDLEVLTARAVARLSPDERASYEAILPFWIPARGTLPEMPNKGPCLSW